MNRRRRRRIVGRLAYELFEQIIISVVSLVLLLLVKEKEYLLHPSIQSKL